VRNLQKAQPTPVSFKYIAEGFEEYHIGGDSGTATAAKAKCVASGIHFLDPTVQLSIYRHRALRLVYSTSTSIFKDSIDDNPITASNAWNRHMMSVIDAARAHVEYETLELMYAQLCTITDEYEPLRPVLTRVVNLYALATIISPTSTSAITWVEDGYLSLSQINDIRQLVDDLLKELYHDATALTDAWDFSDASLCSAIGCYDGNAYERLLAWTRQLPINVNANKTGGVYEKGWKEVIEPMIAKATLEKAKL
jgi:acyl-CoA oxidase